MAPMAVRNLATRNTSTFGAKAVAEPNRPTMAVMEVNTGLRPNLTFAGYMKSISTDFRHATSYQDIFTYH